MTRRRSLLLALPLLAATPLTAQELTTADSNLVYRILTAEDRRDSLAPALAEGMAHTDPRIRLIAERAKGRITDSTYAARSALPALAPRVTWPLPAWRSRYDALRADQTDCAVFEAALRDSVLQVRLRAADIIPAACATRTAAVGSVLWHWITGLADPPPGRGLPPAAWHAAAHALVALARLDPRNGEVRRVRYASHHQWEVRMYVVRAARLAGDTALVRHMTNDPDGNVVETAVDALHAMRGSADDSLYIRLLASPFPQVVRAAALALKGTPHPDARSAAARAYRQWHGRNIDSERDVRLALLELLGRPGSEDAPAPVTTALPRDVVGLALGDTVDLIVRLARGDLFVVRLRGDVAPITGARVLALARSGYYRNTTWHRVIPNFVIQGGGHGANEYVGGDRYFRDELGTLSHLRGGVGMSSRGHDTGDGQWFVDMSDLPRLDQGYTLFGEVVKGMDVVDAVLEGEVITDILPLYHQPQ